MEKKPLTVSWISLWRILFFIAMAAVMFFGLRVLLGLFLAIVISSGLEFMVNFLERRGAPRALGVIIIFLASAILVILTISVILPVLVVDMNTALATLNKLAKDAWWGPLIGFKATQSVNALINRFSSELFGSESSPLGAVANLLGGLALTGSVIVTAFYLSLSRDGVERFIRAVFPADYEEVALRTYENSRKRIGFWFRSQILLSLTMGFLVFISLSILGVKYAVFLGMLTGLLELMPYIGPILAGSAAVIAALMTSPTLALYTLIVFVVIHQLESHVFVPLIVGRSVGLHPVIVIAALLIGAQAGGFLGILISVPAAVVIQEIIEDWAGKKRPRQSLVI
ncbi:MAG: AI-2E family transporter [Patescibacteria group bacterium]